MGLLYPFPISEDEKEHVKIKNDGSLNITTYGLPYVFWAYLGGYLILLSFLIIAIKEPARKLLSMGDPINTTLVYLLWGTVIGTTLGFISLFFTHFIISKKDKSLAKVTKIFWIPIRSKTYELESKDAIFIDHFEGSPNVAKIENRPELSAHQNKGYFEIYITRSDGKKILIDRHSQKREARKLTELLSKY